MNRMKNNVIDPTKTDEYELHMGSAATNQTWGACNRICICPPQHPSLKPHGRRGLSSGCQIGLSYRKGEIDP